MEPLSSDAQKILDWLVLHLPHAKAGKPETYHSYGGGLQELGRSSKKGQRDGDLLNDLSLNELTPWLRASHLPALTGLIVRKSKKPYWPGSGYFKDNGRKTDDEEWWTAEIVKAKEFDWLPFLSYVGKSKVKKADPPLPPAVETPPATDLLKPPPRIKTTIYRILRDTELAQQIKAAHDYDCQLCRESITLADGSKYAEAHHIHPLGGEYPGLDVAENILCVCPWCHVLLDYGVIVIDTEKLATAPSHRVGAEYVQYHNTTIYRGKK